MQWTRGKQSRVHSPTSRPLTLLHLAAGVLAVVVAARVLRCKSGGARAGCAAVRVRHLVSGGTEVSQRTRRSLTEAALKRGKRGLENGGKASDEVVCSALVAVIRCAEEKVTDDRGGARRSSCSTPHTERLAFSPFPLLIKGGFRIKKPCILQ